MGDLIGLRRNKWVARREEETAKTLDEIKRDFERDERIAAQQSQQMNSGYRGSGTGRGNRSSGHSTGRSRGGRGDYRDDRREQYSNNRQSRTQRESVRTDKDGFTQVVHRGGHAQNMDRSFTSNTPRILS